ncbi:hypothetical protein F5Y17DRAFT_43435 [Xylariaceae sp. FL0594]|nr:hypothetical protein F5Y17DRAFT_43435 [Xylariaceae sp. FL0594]
MASPGTPKTMSSRLLTMKFMQRAAASTPLSSTPSTPGSSEQSSKRRKTSHNAEPPQDVDILVNQAAIKAAIAEEEKKVESALLKRAEELGDAHWVLQLPEQNKNQTVQPPLKIVQVGFAQIDTADAMGDDTDQANLPFHSEPALRRYNMEKKKKKAKSSHTESKKKDSDSDSDSDSESGSESGSESESESESESDASSSEETSGRKSFGSKPRASSNTHPIARKLLKGKQSSEQLRALKFQEKRRKREVNLNTPKVGISSISTGGQSPNFTCFTCKQPGHKSSECKKSRNQQ